jgi:hypothetical protein
MLNTMAAASTVMVFQGMIRDSVIKIPIDGERLLLIQSSRSDYITAMFFSSAYRPFRIATSWRPEYLKIQACCFVEIA